MFIMNMVQLSCDVQGNAEKNTIQKHILGGCICFSSFSSWLQYQIRIYDKLLAEKGWHAKLETPKQGHKIFEIIKQLAKTQYVHGNWK